MCEENGSDVLREKGVSKGIIHILDETWQLALKLEFMCLQKYFWNKICIFILFVVHVYLCIILQFLKQNKEGLFLAFTSLNLTVSL